MSEVKIEKRIPMPRPGGIRGEKYPFSKMKIGDSFLVQGKAIDGFRSTASAAGQRLKMKFSVSNVGNGHRVWRIK